MSNKLIALILILLFSFPSAFAVEPVPEVEPENYCKDQDSWAEWDDLVTKYPDDKDIQTLHALRLGLCIKIEQGTITIKDAVDLFDSTHDMVVRKKLAEQKEDKKPL